MRLQPDADALAFGEAMRDLLVNVCDAQALRDAWDGADGRVPGLWKRLADMGVTGLVVPEKYDGSGLDLAGAVPVFVEAGRAALPEPLVATAAASTVLAQAGGPLAQEWESHVSRPTPLPDSGSTAPTAQRPSTGLASRLRPSSSDWRKRCSTARWPMRRCASSSARRSARSKR
jgi:alkylation response protein AidB-like acyl-CoA dehydrogenase